MAEDINSIRTMKEDLLRLQKKGGVVLNDQKVKEQRQTEDTRLKIEEQIKKQREEQLKKEEEELLRIRKVERLREIEEEKESERVEKEQEEVKEQEEIKEAIIVPHVSPKPQIAPTPLPPPKPKFRPTHFPKINIFSKVVKSPEVPKAPEVSPTPPSEKEQLRRDFAELENKRKPLRTQREAIEIKLEQVKRGFKEIAIQEQKIEQQQLILEEKGLSAETPAQRKKIEQERWKIEERRRELEQKRWPWDEKLREFDVQLQEIDQRSEVFDNREAELEKRQKDILRREKNQELGKNKSKLEDDLKDVKKLKDSFSARRIETGVKVNEIKDKLDAITLEEQKVNNKKQEVEKKEAETDDVTEKRGLEKERWVVEEERRKIESQRWEADEELSRLEGQLKQVEERFDSVDKREKEILSQIAELDKELGIPQTPQKPLTPPKSTEKDKALEEARARIATLKKAPETPEVPKVLESSPVPPPVNSEAEERREELLERLRSPLAVDQSRPMPAPRPDEFAKKLPKKPSGREKLGLRIAIVVFIIITLTAVTTFWYWYFVVQKRPSAPSENNEPTTQDDIINPPSGPSTESVSEAVFSVDDTRTITINNLDEVPSLLDQILKEAQIDDKYTRIVIKKDNKELSFQEFGQAMSVRVPVGFYNKLENTFTLFTYSQPQGNRLGFAVKVSESSGLATMLRNREGELENDYQLLFELVGQTKPAVVKYFRSASNVMGYNGPDFRYQTINTNDTGICYSALEQYFVLTSSWRSMERVLNRLEIAPPKQELTMELKVGDRNSEVSILQSWLAKDITVYPAGTISGFYGNMTKQAVIKFQEKYASEILAPQGLNSGTGIVDTFTRNKLNELYAIR